MKLRPRLGALLVLALGLALPPARAADQPADHGGFFFRTHKDADGTEAKFALFVPHEYTKEKAYPLILFLHGSGETGTDGEKQVTVGLGPAVRKR